ncbi:hypothetical protein NESM_000426300 [Novymonas esmeraldas]|uniref:Uncharacterized protein n=1 Tax=Novymonas esmeraldas TaxID=1808958 RepID=A0AAW0EPY9_9TRYP
MRTASEKVTVAFNTARFGVKVADGSFDSDTTIGEVHARLRKKLVKAKVSAGGGAGVDGVAAPGSTGTSSATFIFVRNGTEAFIPAPEQTLQALLDLYASSPGARKLYVTIDPEVFSG